MPIKNVVQKANLMIGQINPHYDMTVNNVKEIHEVYVLIQSAVLLDLDIFKE